MEIGQPGPLLSAAARAHTRELPLKPAAVTLVGPTVTLEPIDLDAHAADLHRLTNGEAVEFAGRHVPAYDSDSLVWRFLFGGPFQSVDELREYLRSQADGADRRCLVVQHHETGLPVGVFNLATNSPANLRIEFGGICISPVVQGAGVLAECTQLALEYCFGLGYERVEWKCDDLNERSKRAAIGLGFTAEGVQQRHMIIKDRYRDTAWFRILNSEWEERLPHH